MKKFIKSNSKNILFDVATPVSLIVPGISTYLIIGIVVALIIFGIRLIIIAKKNNNEKQ